MQCCPPDQPTESLYELTPEEKEAEKRQHFIKVAIAVFLIFIMIFGYVIF